MAHVVTAGELLDGHSVLDVECLDRIYLNAYVPVLQSSGQVVAFMTQHLGKPIPSPALMEHIGTRFRKAVESYASSNGIPWVRFGRGDRKIDVMQPVGVEYCVTSCDLGIFVDQAAESVPPQNPDT